MAKWQRKQIEEAGLHCRQGQVLMQWKYLQERRMLRKYEKMGFKIKKIRKSEQDAQFWLRHSRKNNIELRATSDQVEPMRRKLVEKDGKIRALE